VILTKVNKSSSSSFFFFNLNFGDMYMCIFFFLCVVVVKYTPDQVRKMEESIRIRRAKEPLELVKIVSIFILGF
jgi:hypothetical protein